MSDYTAFSWTEGVTQVGPTRMNALEGAAADASTHHKSGTHAARPTAASGNKNWLYYETDTHVMYLSDGSAWNAVATNPQHHARVFSSVDVSVNANSLGAIPFNSERWDNPNNDQHDNTTNNSRLTCKVAGLYAIAASVQWASSTAERQIRIGLNGTTDLATTSLPLFGTSQQARQAIETQYRLAVNDYVELRVFQGVAAGAAVSVLSQGNHSPELSFAWLMP